MFWLSPTIALVKVNVVEVCLVRREAITFWLLLFVWAGKDASVKMDDLVSRTTR